MKSKIHEFQQLKIKIMSKTTKAKKLTAFIIMMFSLSFTHGQCPGNKTEMSLNYVSLYPGGNCAPCQTECVSNSAIQSRINQGWYIGPCQLGCGTLCPTGKVWACRHKKDCTVECKCVGENNLQAWLANSEACGSGQRIAGAKKAAELFNVYPNPVENSAEISFFSEQEEQVSIKVFDMAGRFVSAPINNVYPQGKNKISWNTKNIEAGVYFLRIEVGNKVQTERISIIK